MQAELLMKSHVVGKRGLASCYSRRYALYANGEIKKIGREELFMCHLSNYFVFLFHPF